MSSPAESIHETIHDPFTAFTKQTIHGTHPYYVGVGWVRVRVSAVNANQPDPARGANLDITTAHPGPVRVTRSRRSARVLGTAFERGIADYIAQQLDDDRIDRRPKYGNSDRGDISGLRIHGQRIVAELKNCSRTELAAWTNQAHIEAGNDDALTGIVIHKRVGKTDPGRQWVTMTLDDLLSLFDGQRHGHRAEEAIA